MLLVFDDWPASQHLTRENPEFQRVLFLVVLWRQIIKDGSILTNILRDSKPTGDRNWGTIPIRTEIRERFQEIRN